ncbi:MAG TPA: hypothetical protein VM841_14065 [Actinomycetota bacterium]|nr:hypothetical protein [Actinomycetota bacterium]
MTRRLRRTVSILWLSSLLLVVSPMTQAFAREMETDGMTGGGPAGAASSRLVSDGLGWWWLLIVAGIVVGGALLVALFDTLRKRPPRIPRAHPA